MARLMQRLGEGGRIPFDEFMSIALYDPDGGYFATGPLRSEADGDFLTSPEVSPLFGETMARFVASEAGRCCAKTPITVVEAGAGSGSLLDPLLVALTAMDLPRSPIEPWAIEVSDAARRRLEARIPDVRVVASLEVVPAQRCGVVLANELLDNLPAAIAVRRGAGWAERMVETDGESLLWVESPARPAVAAWAERFCGPVVEGSIVEVQIEIGEWIAAALSRLQCGSLLVVDYGDTAAGLASRREEGTVRTYSAHHLGPDPLLLPGETDITMDVNIDAVVEAMEEAGAGVTMFTQAEFLTQWGLQDRIDELRMLELEHARSGATMPRLQAHSAITGARALLHPRGLGDFRVVVGQV